MHAGGVPVRPERVAERIGHAGARDGGRSLVIPAQRRHEVEALADQVNAAPLTPRHYTANL